MTTENNRFPLLIFPPLLPAPLHSFLLKISLIPMQQLYLSYKKSLGKTGTLGAGQSISEPNIWFS